MKKDTLVGILVAAVVIALAALTLPAGLSDADNGEFLLLGLEGGVVHPPGYPLYALLLRFWSSLPTPLGTVAHFSSLSALLGGGAAFFLFAFCRKMDLSVRISVFATWVAFSSLPLWRMNTLVEPFALHHFLVALIMWLCAGFRAESSTSRLMPWMGLLWGLSFCNHHTAVFLAPMVLFLVMKQRPSPGLLKTWFLKFALGFLLGLLPLLYFYIDHPSLSFVWGDWSGWEQIGAHLLRVEYGTFQWAAASENEKGIALGAKGFVRLLGFGLSWLFALLSLWGAWFLLFKDSEQSRNPVAQGLVIAFLAYFIVFLGIGNSICSDPLSSLLQRFLGLPFLLMASFTGAGLQSLSSLDGRIEKKPVVEIVAFALLLFQLLWIYPLATRSDETFVQEHMDHIANLVSDNEVLVASSDVEYFGLSFLKSKQKRSFTVISVWLYSRPWYKERLANELHIDAKNMPEDIWRFVDDLNHTKDVVFVQPEVMGKNPLFQGRWFPVGPILRMPQAGKKRPSLIEIYRQNEEVFERQLNLPVYGGLGLKRTIEQSLYVDYIFPWAFMCDLLPEQFRKEKNLACLLAEKMKIQ